MFIFNSHQVKDVFHNTVYLQKNDRDYRGILVTPRVETSCIMVETVSRSYLFERVDVDLFGAVYSVYSSSLFIQPFSPLRLPLLRDVSSRSLRLLRKYQQLPTKKDRERKKKYITTCVVYA